MNSKIFSIFTILFVLLTTSALASKVITVTSPGVGPWVRNSDQVVSWWCNECSKRGDYHKLWVEIYKGFLTNKFHFIVPLYIENVIVQIIQIRPDSLVEVFKKVVSCLL
jgi:hypothetical protein